MEEKAGDMIEEAIDNDVAFLVVGDPFGYAQSWFCYVHYWSCNNVLII